MMSLIMRLPGRFGQGSTLGLLAQREGWGTRALIIGTKPVSRLEWEWFLERDLNL